MSPRKLRGIDLTTEEMFSALRSGFVPEERPDGELWSFDSQDARNNAKIGQDKPLICLQATIVPALRTMRVTSDW